MAVDDISDCGLDLGFFLFLLLEQLLEFHLRVLLRFEGQLFFHFYAPVLALSFLAIHLLSIQYFHNMWLAHEFGHLLGKVALSRILMGVEFFNKLLREGDCTI